MKKKNKNTITTMNQEVKVIEVEIRDSFARLVIEHKGERYEGLLLKSGAVKKEWEDKHIMKLENNNKTDNNP